MRISPASEEAHVMEGFCTCLISATKRIPMRDCGLSTHRVEARELRKSERPRA